MRMRGGYVRVCTGLWGGRVGAGGSKARGMRSESKT